MAQIGSITVSYIGGFKWVGHVVTTAMPDSITNHNGHRQMDHTLADRRGPPEEPTRLQEDQSEPGDEPDRVYELEAEARREEHLL